jgi:hypothetical protein
MVSPAQPSHADQGGGGGGTKKSKDNSVMEGIRKDEERGEDGREERENRCRG